MKLFNKMNLKHSGKKKYGNSAKRKEDKYERKENNFPNNKNNLQTKLDLFMKWNLKHSL